MAINRFSQVQEVNYRPSVLPLPYQELMQQGLMKQKAYDDNEDYEYKLGALMQSLQADPKARFAKQIVDDKYNQRMTDLSTKIVDKGDMDYTKELHKIYNEYINDPLVQGIKQRKLNYDKYQKDAIDNKEKYASFYDPYMNEGNIQSHYKKTGQLHNFDYQGMDYKQDYLKVGQDLVKDIAKSGSLTDAFVRNKDGSVAYDELGNRAKIKRGSEGVVRGTVNRIAEQNAEPFLQTKEGRYFMHELVGRGDFEYGDLNPDQQKIVKQQATRYLAKLAEKQIGVNTTYGEDIQALNEAQLKKLQDDESPEAVDAGTVKVGSIVDVDPYKVNIPKTSSEKSAERLTSYADFDQGGKSTKGASEPSEDKDIKINFNESQKVILEKAKRAFGEFPATDLGNAKLINKYLDNFKDKSYANVVLEYKDTKKAEEENRRLFGADEKGSSAIVNRTAKLISGDGDKQLTGQDFLQKYGDEGKYSIVVSGELTPDNPYFKSGRQVVVRENNGKGKPGPIVAQYAISGTRNEDAENEYKRAFYNAKYTPEGRSVVPLNVEGKTENYIVDYEDDTHHNLDDKYRSQKTGEKVRLLNKDGKVVVDWITGENAIDKLYNEIH